MPNVKYNVEANYSLGLGVSQGTDEHLPATAREREALGLQIREYA